MTRLAFLGLGSMGLPMADRLLAAGHEVRAWNRTLSRGAALVEAGATMADSPAGAASNAEIVITMLSDPAALEAVLFGEQGVASTIAQDATLVDMSTVGPSPIRAAAERLAPVAVLDAPVLGTVPHAESGSLSILVGGDRAALERCRPVLETLGTVLHVGPSGAGALTKLANNAASLSGLVAVGEVLALTDRAGLDPEAVLDAIATGPLASAVERWRAKISGRVDRVDFRLTLARKDLALAIEEASSIGVRLAVPEAAATRYEEAIAAGNADEDNSAVVRVLRS